MKIGTHNLGRNRYGQLGLVTVEEEEVHLIVGSNRVALSDEQARLLRDVLSSDGSQ